MRQRHAVFAAAVALALAIPLQGAVARDVIVFAAASLKNALDDAMATFANAGGGRVVASYAASGGKWHRLASTRRCCAQVWDASAIQSTMAAP